MTCRRLHDPVLLPLPRALLLLPLPVRRMKVTWAGPLYLHNVAPNVTAVFYCSTVHNLSCPSLPHPQSFLTQSSTSTPCTSCSHPTVPATATPLHALLSNTNDASLRQCITPRATIKPPLSHACCKKRTPTARVAMPLPRGRCAFPTTPCTSLLLLNTSRGSTLVILLHALVKPRPAPPPSPPPLPPPPR